MTGRRPRHSQWNRREVLATALKGGAAAVATAYGLRPDCALADIPAEFDGTKFQLAAPEPNPKRGGVLRYGITSRPPHFDVHQSGTINNLGCQGCMFDNLIRRDPRVSGKTIIPDLAHSWQISKDGKTYTFFLRKDVFFHDGAEFTAEDAKATYDRTVGHLHPALHFVQHGERDQRPLQVHDRIQAVAAAPRQFHDVGVRQRVERNRAQEDARGQPVQPPAGGRYPRHRPL